MCEIFAFNQNIWGGASPFTDLGQSGNTFALAGDQTSKLTVCNVPLHVQL